MMRDRAEMERSKMEMEVRCAGCGNSFKVAPSEESRMVKCPKCGGEVFVPASLGGAELPQTPPPPLPSPPRHLLSGVEVMAIVIVVGLIVGGAVFWAVRSSRPKPPPKRPQQPTKRPPLRPSPEEKAAQECLRRLTDVASAIRKYLRKFKRLPDELQALVRAGFLQKDQLGCEKGRYAYFPEEATAAKEEGILDAPILVADSVASAHMGKRNTITLGLDVITLNEAVVKERLRVARKALHKRKAEQARLKEEKRRREERAKAAYEEAIRLLKDAKYEAAKMALKRLKEEFAQTDFLKKNSPAIAATQKEVDLMLLLTRARSLLEKHQFDAAKEIYEKLIKEGGKERAEKELELMSHYKRALTLRNSGDLENARKSLDLLDGKTKEPFWRRLVRVARQEIESYEEGARRLLKSAEEALKRGDAQRALALCEELVWCYKYAEAAKNAAPLKEKALKSAPLWVRFADRPARALLMEGSTSQKKEIFNAIDKALSFLVSAQAKDGSWRPDAQGPSAAEPEAVTAAVLLALLSEGNTHKSGCYRTSVAAGLSWLKSRQRKDGYIGSAKLPSQRFSHALATLYLAELYGTTRDPDIKAILRKAVEYALNIKTPAGGWKRSAADAHDDVMLTSWMLLAISAAKRYAPSLVAWTSFETALRVFDERTDDRGRVEYIKPKTPIAERSRLPYQEMLIKTAAAAFARLLTTPDTSNPQIKKSVSFINLVKPRKDDRNHLYWFFATHLMWYQGRKFKFFWSPTMRALLALQIKEGALAGSWDASVPWAGFRGGRLFDTSLSVLTLNVEVFRFGGFGATKPKPQEELVRVICKDGSVRRGTLVEKTPDYIRIRTKGGSVKIKRKDIEKIEPLKE